KRRKKRHHVMNRYRIGNFEDVSAPGREHEVDSLSMSPVNSEKSGIVKKASPMATRSAIRNLPD
ncbi:MAG: hypothetical protein J6Q02_11430, partial [Lachnospiraceae bacterium]|nr:hypothetical protein [Lachnospiraceae bacterium]